MFERLKFRTAKSIVPGDAIHVGNGLQTVVGINSLRDQRIITFTFASGKVLTTRPHTRLFIRTAPGVRS